MKYQAAKISLMLCVKIRRKIERQGGLRAVHHNRARYAIASAITLLHAKTTQYDLKKVMEQFLIKKRAINELL